MLATFGGRHLAKRLAGAPKKKRAPAPPSCGRPEAEKSAISRRDDAAAAGADGSSYSIAEATYEIGV